MKSLLVLACALVVAIGINAQNSKKIKVKSFEENIVLSCDNIDSKTNVSFTTKCKEGSLQIDQKDISVGGGCAGKIKRIYTVTDACGNQAAFEQIIELKDEIAPVFEMVPPEVTFSNRIDYMESPLTKFPPVRDNCSAAIEKEELIVSDSFENGIMTLTKMYIATDGCGNKTEYQQLIHFDIDED